MYIRELSSTALLWLLCLYSRSLYITPLWALVQLRLFFIFHDLCHNSFFPYKSLNIITSYIIGTLVKIGRREWIRQHNSHHATLNNLTFSFQQTGSISLETFNNYDTLTKFTYRLGYSFFGYYLLAPFLYLFVYQRYMSTLTENLLVAIYYFCLYSYDPYVLRIEICASLLGVMLSLIFLHGQHKFDGAYRQNKGWDRKTAVLRGTVFIDVPWWLRYFTYNIEYHHVHHLDSSIPGYQLRQIGEPDLENCGVARTTLWDIIRDSYAERSVFDETLQQFVSPKMNTEIDPRTTKRP